MALSLTVDWSLDFGTEVELRRRIANLEAGERLRRSNGQPDDDYLDGYLDGYRNALAVIARGRPYDGEVPSPAEV